MRLLLAPKFLTDYRMTTWKFIAGFSVIFAMAACLATWLVLGDLSPSHSYFLDHVALPNIIRQLLVIPYVVVLVAKSDTEFGDLVVATTAEFVQWLVVGFLLALFTNFVFRRST
jgi:hypothetical protein